MSSRNIFGENSIQAVRIGLQSQSWKRLSMFMDAVHSSINARHLLPWQLVSEQNDMKIRAPRKFCSSELSYEEALWQFFLALSWSCGDYYSNLTDLLKPKRDYVEMHSRDMLTIVIDLNRSAGLLQTIIWSEYAGQFDMWGRGKFRPAKHAYSRHLRLKPSASGLPCT